MPYIKPEERIELDAGRDPSNPGQMNYAISLAMNRYIARYGLSYSTVNELVGVLECAKMELYRRVAAPYEDGKCATNGDVYTI